MEGITKKLLLLYVGPVSYTHLDVYKRQIIIRATGRQSKSVKKQVSLDLTNNNVTIPVGFLVANGLPFNVLISCDVLRQHSAVIDLSRGIVSLTSEEGVWTAELVNGNRAPSVRASCHLVKKYFCRNNTLPEVIRYEDDNQELWYRNLEEVRAFQREKTGQQISEVQAEKLIAI